MAARTRTAANSADLLVPRVAHLEREMGEVRQSLSAISVTLQDIARTQAEMRASAPADWSVMLNNVNSIAWLAALLIGGVIWISSMVNQKPAKDLEARLAVLEMQLKIDKR